MVNYNKQGQEFLVLKSDEDKMLDMGPQLLAHQPALVAAIVHCLMLEFGFDKFYYSFQQMGWI